MADVVVTGGSGFVGRHAVAALRAAGHNVSEVGRRPGSDAPFTRTDFEPGRMPSFGSATVVHCAAVTEDGFSDQLAADNVRLTRAALELADGLFIHMSSSSVYDLSKPSMNVREVEATGDYRWFNSYGPSKFESERLVHAARGQATVLRPHGVYGDGDTTLEPRLRQLASHGVLPLPNGGRPRHQLTWVGNLAHAIVRAVDVQLAGVHTINIADPEPVSIREAALAALGQRRIINVPTALALAASRVSSRIPQYSILQLGYDRTYDLRLAGELLGYAPVSDGLRRAFGR